jgi:NAD(P)-dependent dehydrogenase (short-subunit alcohol dehydrogenase family)
MAHNDNSRVWFITGASSGIGRALAQRALDAGDRVVASFGRIDVVVNNAGVGVFGALEDLSDDELRRGFETNVFGAINTIRAVLPQLRAQRSGLIVQLSSLEGIAPAVAGESAYAATKFAVEGLCEALRHDVGQLGIRVTLVEPGPTRTTFGDRDELTARARELERWDALSRSTAMAAA